MVPDNSYKFRYLHHHQRRNEYSLKIRGVRRQDFGRYNCHVQSNDTQKFEENASIIITGTYRFKKITCIGIINNKFLIDLYHVICGVSISRVIIICKI